MLAAVPLLLGLIVQAAPPTTTTTTTTTATTATATTTTTTPAAARPAAGQPRAVKRSLASTTWPVEPAFNAGFLASEDGILPFVGVTVFVPIWPGLGPSLVARGCGTQVGQLSFYEGSVGVGVGWEARLENVHARVTLAPAVLASGFQFVDGGGDGDQGLGFGPALLLPLDLSLPLGGGVAFTGSIEPGLSRSVLHVVDGAVAVGRDRLFVFIGAGLTFGGPPSED
ncbi:MAG: hypothetical protein Q8O67_00345 [Deltaproteobacteria bacterium]|nr:hypothetical protein [Deltaproteobacteria bacterium]